MMSRLASQLFLRQLFPRQSYPYPKLLSLERVLLGLAWLGTLQPASLYVGQRFPLLAMLVMLLFGWFGTRLPILEPLRYRIGFTGLSLGLLLMMTLLSGNRSFLLLHVVFLMRSSLLFQWPGQLLIAILAFGIFGTSLYYQLHYFAIPLSQVPVLTQFGFGRLLGLVVIAYLLCLGFVIIMMNALMAERNSRVQLIQAHRQLKAYSTRIERQAMLEERNRIARDIHDALGHSLTGINLQMETVLKLWDRDPQQARAMLMEAKKLGTTALQEVRQSVATLRASPLPSKSLAEQVQTLLQGIQNRTSLVLNTDIQISHDIPSDIQIAAYRILQEALTNICKHAKATTVVLKLWSTSEQLALEIRDDGQGFRLTDNTTGFGLQSMEERVQSLGGAFQINSDLDQGCQIAVSLPLPQR